MASTQRRAAAFSAIWRALTASKAGPALSQRLTALPRMFWYTLTGRYDGFGRLFADRSGDALHRLSDRSDPGGDFLLVPGLLDDAVVATWIAGAVLVRDRALPAVGAGPRAEGGVAEACADVIDGDVV